MGSERTDATGRVVTRSAATETAYRARYPRLCEAARLAPDNIQEIVEWFCGRHDCWAPATINQYRAVIVQAIEDTPRLSTDEVDDLLDRLAIRPIPRRKGPARTSRRKRKSVPRQEFDRLLERLVKGDHPDDRLAARFLGHNVRLFLRPMEWLMATIANGFLIIRNAKSTNGRSHGTHRRLDLRDYDSERTKDLVSLLLALRKRAAEAKSIARFWGKLAARIARACEKIGIKRISLYTTRHVGMANAKSWMSPEEVAAVAGHKTTATATAHYAKRRTGWHIKLQGVPRPVVDDVQRVVRSPKASREANLNEIKKRLAQFESEQEIPAFRM